MVRIKWSNNIQSLIEVQQVWDVADELKHCRSNGKQVEVCAFCATKEIAEASGKSHICEPRAHQTVEYGVNPACELNSRVIIQFHLLFWTGGSGDVNLENAHGDLECWIYETELAWSQNALFVFTIWLTTLIAISQLHLESEVQHTVDEGSKQAQATYDSGYSLEELVMIENWFTH